MSDLDFPAKQAREFTDNYEQMNAEQWYDEFKYKIFDKIKVAALKGKETIQIFGEDWGGNETKKKHLLSNLEELGYRTILKDEPRENIIVAW